MIFVSWQRIRVGPSRRSVSALEFPQDVKRYFWESVKASFIDAQVIIIENSHQLPGDGTLDGVKVELFTGNFQGRRGFIPPTGGAA